MRAQELESDGRKAACIDSEYEINIYIFSTRGASILRRESDTNDLCERSAEAQGLQIELRLNGLYRGELGFY